MRWKMIPPQITAVPVLVEIIADMNHRIDVPSRQHLVGIEVAGGVIGTRHQGKAGPFSTRRGRRSCSPHRRAHRTNPELKVIGGGGTQAGDIQFDRVVGLGSRPSTGRRVEPVPGCSQHVGHRRIGGQHPLHRRVRRQPANPCPKHDAICQGITGGHPVLETGMTRFRALNRRARFGTVLCTTGEHHGRTGGAHEKASARQRTLGQTPHAAQTSAHDREPCESLKDGFAL